MAVKIRKVETKPDLDRFIRFPGKIYPRDQSWGGRLRKIFAFEKAAGII